MGIVEPFCLFVFNSRILPRRYTLSGQPGSLFAVGLLGVFEKLHMVQLIEGFLRPSRVFSRNELQQEEAPVLLERKYNRIDR